MKKLWIPILCFGLLLCIGCGAKEELPGEEPVKEEPPAEDTITEDTEKDAPTEKYAAVEDGELVVRLAGNPTTGYSWLWKLDGDECVTGDEGKYTMDENEAELVGVGGVFKFRFTPAADGSAAIRFSYERSWEENSAVDTYEVAVTVADGEITIG